MTIGDCAPRAGIEPFSALVDKVMRPASPTPQRGGCVLGRRQRGLTPRLDRRSTALDAFPNATMIHLRVHASWLNQIEIYFSVVQRKHSLPDNFPDLEVLANQLTAFEARHNSAARPFDWRFNRNDLNRLVLTRIAA